MANQTSKNVHAGSAFDLLGKSYNIVKENWQIFAIVNIFAIIYAVLDAMNPNDLDTNGRNNFMFGGVSDLSGFQLAAIIGGGLLLLLLYMAVSFFFFTMATSLEVKSAGGKKPDFNELLNDGKRYFFPLLGLMIVMGIVITVGLILLIVPGIIAIGRLALAPYIMIDKKVGVEEALAQSNALGKKYFGKVWAAIGVMILIGILTAILSSIPVLGPLAAVAVSIAFSLVVALRYQQFKGHKV